MIDQTGSRERRVCLVQHCAGRTGSTISGHLLAAGFRESGWEVDVAFGSEGPMIAEYAKLGCRPHVVPHKNWLRGGNVQQSTRRILAEWRNSGAFRRLIREVRPDVVYVNSLVSLAAALAARREGVPCVWHIRELFDDVGGEMHVPACGGRPLVRWLLQKLATHRVTISRSVAENILGTVDPAIVEVVPNAAGEEFFELPDDLPACRTVFGLPLDVPVIGVPGTLRPMKGHSFFLEAAAHVARQIPRCVFAITGTGESSFESQLRVQTEQLGLAENVRFLGTLTDMPRFYRACDVVCVPSVAEPFGRTVIEAFAIGTPVVATAVGGLAETINDGVTGMLVPFGAVEALASKLVQLLQDTECRDRLSVAGQAMARERFHRADYQRRVTSIAGEVLCS